MEAKENDNNITNDFLNNENPFIYSTDRIVPNPKLEVVQSLQPSFIPYALNQEELKANFVRFLEKNTNNIISDMINEYCYKNQLPLVTEEMLCDSNDYTNEDLVDLLIKIKSVRLWNKQQQLREKVLSGLVNTMSESEIIKAYNCKLPKEEEDEIIVNELKKKLEFNN